MRKPRHALTRYMHQFDEVRAVLHELDGLSDAELKSLGTSRDRLEDYAWQEALRRRAARLSQHPELMAA